MSRPYILAESTWQTVRNTPYEVAILPWGATEAHNYHLPYATDTLQCDAIAADSARKAWEEGAKVVVLPTIPIGVNTGQVNVRLDINMNPSTQFSVLRDIVATLDHQSIKKLVVLNGHGGNDFKQMIRELLPAFPEMTIIQIHWFRILDAAAHFDDPGDHADEMETSLMMHLHTDLVRPLSEAGPGSVHAFRIAALNEGWAWTQRSWLEATDDTGVGNPALASPEKGERFLDALTDKISKFLTDFAKTPRDEMYVRSSA